MLKVDIRNRILKPKVVETNKCKGCILVGECVCVVCGEKQRSDGKSIALLPCNEKGELI